MHRRYWTPAVALVAIIGGCEIVSEVDTNGLAQIKCPEGRTLCGDQFCWDLQSSPSNCGACGQACGSSEICSAGKCECMSGMSRCGQQCTSLMFDRNNCGSCGHACSSVQTCQGSLCVDCGGGYSYCNGACTDILSDPYNCGSCGHSCGGSSCVSGVCAESDGGDNVCLSAPDAPLCLGCCQTKHPNFQTAWAAIVNCICVSPGSCQTACSGDDFCQSQLGSASCYACILPVIQPGAPCDLAGKQACQDGADCLGYVACRESCSCTWGVCPGADAGDGASDDAGESGPVEAGFEAGDGGADASID